ncbi:MAG: hypothetical protein PHE25_04170 [Candidatus Gracilibacteria bacterium]|nr:hypothetical protein [Candidatus Gracilibacteria bacterium]
MAKLNLSALKKSGKTNDIITNDVVDGIEEININSIENVNSVELEQKKQEIDNSSSKKKLSLKQLNINGVNEINNEIHLEKNDNIKVEEELKEKNMKIGIKSLIDNSKISNKLEEDEFLQISEEEGDNKINDIIEVQEVENVQEIFTEFKGSYIEENKDIQKESVKETIKEPIIQIENENIANENTQIYEIETLQSNIKETSKDKIAFSINLKQYFENIKTFGLFKNRKIVFASFFLILSIILTGGLIINNLETKSNVQEINQNKIENKAINQNIKNSQQQPVIDKTQNKDIEPENVKVIDTKLDEDDIKIQENNIVKENLETGIDNNNNSSKINRKLTKFLIDKYKTK